MALLGGEDARVGKLRARQDRRFQEQRGMSAVSVVTSMVTSRGVRALLLCRVERRRDMLRAVTGGHRLYIYNLHDNTPTGRRSRDKYLQNKGGGGV